MHTVTMYIVRKYFRSICCCFHHIPTQTFINYHLFEVSFDALDLSHLSSPPLLTYLYSVEVNYRKDPFLMDSYF
jgi:hypothetical protein